MPKVAKTDDEIKACFEVMSELRPHLKKEEFASLIRHMETEGYRLVYVESEGKVAALAGYRIYTNLFMGKHLYVDDLVTATDERSRGHGKHLLDWLRDIAIKEDCRFLHLDSGTQRGRAHKFYFEQGMTIASYHFCEELPGQN